MRGDGVTMTADDLVGAWKLRRWEISYPATGRVTRPFGEDAIGMILYTPDGYMSAVLARRERGEFSTPILPKAPAAEKLRAFDGYMHYAGRYFVVQGDVHHEVEFALNMSLVGTTQIREALLDGDRLTLSAEEPLEGGEMRRHRLEWLRASVAGGLPG
jgi:hypothetical protein